MSKQRQNMRGTVNPGDAKEPTRNSSSSSASIPLRDRGWRDTEQPYRTWLFQEVAMALPPTIVVLGAFFGTQILTDHPILFASLASSAFLIYREPRHRMNRVRVMVAAQILGAGLGTAASLIFGGGYAAGAAAMVVTISLLILLDIVHPPAVSTALGFSLLGPGYGALGTFLLAVAIVAVLALLQFVVIQMLRRLEARYGIAISPRDRPEQGQ